MLNVECRWKYREERNEYIFQLGGRRPNEHGDGYRVRVPRPDLNDCLPPPPLQLSYDIYFIGVSLPSSMMIYNCWSLGCNYYNYRFFVGLSHPSVSRTRTGRFFSLHPLSFSGSTPLILRLLFSSFLLPATSRVSPLLSSLLLSSPLHSFFSCFSCFSSFKRPKVHACIHTYVHTYHITFSNIANENGFRKYHHDDASRILSRFPQNFTAPLYSCSRESFGLSIRAKDTSYHEKSTRVSVHSFHLVGKLNTSYHLCILYKLVCARSCAKLFV